MSVEDKDKVDAIGIDKKTAKVDLLISDHLDWENEKEHLIILQEKINRYRDFIGSGELFESYPNSKGRNIVISVALKYDIPDSSNHFFYKMEELLKKENIEFHFRKLEV